MNDVVLVTGSSGLIGYALAERLAARYRTIGFDRAGPSHPPPSVDCLAVDLTSDDSVAGGLTAVRQRYGSRIASIIHLAAYYDFSGADSPMYEEVTVRGTRRLLHALRNVEVEQFVFSSTMLVHRPCEPGERLTESWPLDPRWPYPASKVRTEELIRCERGNIPALVLRIAGVYDDGCHSIPLAHQIQRIYERQLTSHVFPGHLAHGQAYVHRDDLIDACLACIERRGALPPELTLLIGEESTLSYDELQHTFGRLIHGEDWQTREIPKAAARAGAWTLEHVPGEEEPFIRSWMIDCADDHYALDTTAAQMHLGWRTQRTLRETLRKMIAELRRDPARWYREHGLSGPPDSAEAAAKDGTFSFDDDRRKE